MQVGVLRQGLRRPQAIMASAVVLVASILLLVGWKAFQVDPRHAFQVQAEAIHMDGFTAENNGFRAVGGRSSHMVAGRFKLHPGQRYAFSFSVDATPGAPASVVVDLFGIGYDNPAQERSFYTRPGQTSVHWSDTIDVGQSIPKEVSLRIFYDGVGGLRISDIRVVEIPVWQMWIGHLLSALVLIIAAFFVAALAAWSNDGRHGRSAPSPWSLLSALWLGGALVRFLGAQLLPYWSGDEYLYKMVAMGIWAGGGRSGIPTPDQILHATNMPNMLYPYLIAPSFLLGDSFYTGVRLINALIMASAVFPTWLIARRFLSARLSVLVGLASIALPGVFISAYAVTEVLYFPLYLWACWAGLRVLERPTSLVEPVFFGVLVGLVLNVRLNGITLLLALLATLILVALNERTLRRFVTRPVWLLAPLVSYIVFKLISVSLAAPSTDGLGMYGNRLYGWRETIMSDPQGLKALLLGHLTILAIPFTLALATGIGLLLSQRDSAVDQKTWSATLYLLMASAAAIGMAIVFTIGIAPSDLGGLGRWHSRYYFSSFPLLLILLFFPRPRRTHAALGWYAYWTFVLAIIGAAVLFLFVYRFNVSPWFGSTVDSMEAQWYRFSHWWFVGFAALTLVTAVAAEGTMRRTLQMSLLGAWLVVANAGTWRELSRSPGAFDAGCSALAQEMVAHEPGGIAVVASGRRELVDNTFWLPNLPVALRMLPDGGVVDGRSLGQARYVLADERIEVTHATRLPGTGTCSIYKVD